MGDKRVKEAIETLMTYRKATTPVDIATNATTEHERVQITTLGEVSSHDINSDTLLIVGNSETFVFNGKMVTPRGYKKVLVTDPQSPRQLPYWAIGHQ